jgi:hypothetical protein
VRVARFALRLPLPQQRSPGAEPPSAPVYFGVRNDAAAMGLSEGWVRGALDGLPEPRRLAAGADFQKVFAPLDERPKALSYLNLPRLRRVIESSNMLRMVLSSNVQARRMMEVFFTEEGMGVGIGQTIVELEDGARTTTFGPEWMAGGPKMIGLVAATVMQNAVEGLGRGRPPLPQREGAP